MNNIFSISKYNKPQKKYFKLAINIAIVLIISLIYFLSNEKVTLWFDTDYYWNLADTFINNGKFSFKFYNDTLRGYLWPFILFIFKQIGNITSINPYYIYLVSISIVYGLCFYMILPDLFLGFLNIDKCKHCVRLLFCFVSIFMLKGLYLYPLTDLPAFLCCSIAISLLIKSVKEISRKKCLLCAFLCGLFSWCAYEIRPIYLICIIGILLYYIYYSITKNYKNLLLIISLLLGIFLVALPQMIINKYNFNVISPMIQTELFYNGQSLYLMQLSWGITTQKYETNINLNIYPEYGVHFYDPLGLQLLKSEEIDGFSNYIQYIVFVFHHIIDMALIYLKHLFNGIDLIYREQYITNIYKFRYGIQFLNYTMLSFGILGFKENFINKFNNHSLKAKINYSVFILYMLPTILVIPTAIEVRFFIGLLLILYFYGCLYFINSVSQFKQKKAINIKQISFIVCFIVLCFLMNKSTYDVLLLLKI